MVKKDKGRRIIPGLGTRTCSNEKVSCSHPWILIHVPRFAVFFAKVQC